MYCPTMCAGLTISFFLIIQPLFPCFLHHYCLQIIYTTNFLKENVYLLVVYAWTGSSFVSKCKMLLRVVKAAYTRKHIYMLLQYVDKHVHDYIIMTVCK